MFASTYYFTILSLAGPIHAYPIVQATSWFTSLLSAVDDHDEIFDSPLCFDLVISVVLVLAGGVFAGLTIGLMGLDELHLRVLASSSDDQREKRNAQKTLSLLEKGRHWVLVVLLLGNVVVNESLPIFLDNAIGGGLTAIIISTAAIVIFGEVIPQALSVKYGLSIGATCAPIVHAMMWIFSPVAWPFAKALDFLLGAHTTHTYKRKELKSLLELHRDGPEPLHDLEIETVGRVLDMGSKLIEDLMTPIQSISTLSTKAVLDDVAVSKMLSSGRTRFLVYEPERPLVFVGFLPTDKLVAYDTTNELLVGDFPLCPLYSICSDAGSFEALNIFRVSHSPLLLVTRGAEETPQCDVIGTISLEDIVAHVLLSTPSSLPSMNSMQKGKLSSPKRSYVKPQPTIDTTTTTLLSEREESSDGDRSTLIGTPKSISSESGMTSPVMAGYGSTMLATRPNNMHRKWSC